MMFFDQGEIGGTIHYNRTWLTPGVYRRPFHFSCGCMVLGSVLYALAFRANYLYLILIGRMVQGGGMWHVLLRARM